MEWLAVRLAGIPGEAAVTLDVVGHHQEARRRRTARRRRFQTCEGG
jgi:hypothetical protein